MSVGRVRLMVAQLVLAVLAAAVVGVCELVLSYDAERAVAHAAGVDHAVDGLFPLGLDGLLMTATFAAVTLHGASLWTRRYVWLVFGAGLAVALACNGAHSFAVRGQVVLTQEQAFAVSAVPPASAAAAVHLVVLIVRHVGQVLAAWRALQAPAERSQAPTGERRALDPDAESRGARKRPVGGRGGHARGVGGG